MRIVGKKLRNAADIQLGMCKYLLFSFKWCQRKRCIFYTCRTEGPQATTGKVPYSWGEGDEMLGWHHWLNGHAFECTPGDGDGQGSLACCSPWGRKSQTQFSDWAISLFPIQVSRPKSSALGERKACLDRVMIALEDPSACSSASCFPRKPASEQKSFSSFLGVCTLEFGAVYTYGVDEWMTWLFL